VSSFQAANTEGSLENLRKIKEVVKCFLKFGIGSVLNYAMVYPRKYPEVSFILSYF